MNSYSLSLRIDAVQTPAKDVRMFTLVNAQGESLPAFDAGAHIELQLPNGLGRSYSLLNAPGDTARYQIAVHHSPTSSGGSRFMHEALDAGKVLRATEPRNLFLLNEEAGHTCLIAGGIGVTPLMAMVQRLNVLGKSWELHYCARTLDYAAFVPELNALAQDGNGALHLYFDQITDGKSLNIAELVQATAPDTHLYCCGPAGMLEAFENATVDISERAHVEYFSAKSEAALDGGFEIQLQRSGLTLQVPPGRSILDVVTEAGINVLTSCREGICGTCETTIIEGQADHRDALLTPDEQAENKTMMICCSGAKSTRMVLDL